MSPRISRNGVWLGSNEIKLELELVTQRAWYHGCLVHVARHEFQILAYLLLKSPDVVGRDEMRRVIWDGVEVSQKIVDVHVARMREKIPYVVKTKYRGYGQEGGYYV